MKKHLSFLLLALIIGVSAMAQEAEAPAKNSHWHGKGNIGLNFAQGSYTNWAAGGQNTLSWMGTFNYSINYAKNNFKWTNTLNTALGYSFFDFKKKAIKTDDQIEFTSLAALKATKTLNYSLELAFRSQFAKGYDYKVDSTHYISKWLAPAYISLGLGMEWVPSEHFSLNFAPLAGRITIVNDTVLAANGAYGVNTLDANDPTDHTIRTIRYEFGARLVAQLNYTIFKNVDFNSKLELFSNYLNHPERIDVDWQNLIVLKVNSWLNCNFGTHLIYDYDIKFPIVDDQGAPVIDPSTGEAAMTKGSKVQFKEVLSVGFLINI